MVLCLGGLIYASSPLASQLTDDYEYMAMGQISGTNWTMFLSPSRGHPRFLPIVARRLGWELALSLLPGPFWAVPKARDETATSWEEPHRFRRSPRPPRQLSGVAGESFRHWRQRDKEMTVKQVHRRSAPSGQACNAMTGGVRTACRPVGSSFSQPQGPKVSWVQWSSSNLYWKDTAVLQVRAI